MRDKEVLGEANKMCGRYYIAGDEQLEELARRLAYEHNIPVGTGDIVPTQNAPVYVNEGRVRAVPMKWGFKGENGTLVINARSESAEQKRSFSELLRRYRLIIPAAGYYEWDVRRQRHSYAPCGGGILFMAGLYQPADRSFVILTCAAKGDAAKVHPRMPLVFSRSAAQAWLRPETDGKTMIQSAQKREMREIEGQVSMEI